MPRVNWHQLQSDKLSATTISKCQLSTAIGSKNKKKVAGIVQGGGLEKKKQRENVCVKGSGKKFEGTFGKRGQEKSSSGHLGVCVCVCV